MDEGVKAIRSFIIRKLAKARKPKRAGACLDPYRDGYVAALSMVQSFIDKVVIAGKEDQSDG